MELRWNTGRKSLFSKYENQYWGGGPDDSEPPNLPCQPGQYWRKALSTGEGTYVGTALEVRGTKLGAEENLCGAAQFTRSLGTLTGTVDPELNEFRSTMTSRFGTHPIVWRRIRCVGEEASKLIAPPPPPVEPVPPPPPAPPPPPTTSSGGCGCSTPGAD